MIIDGKTYRRNIFGNLVPAMEAGPEDLTATTDTMMRQASGQKGTASGGMDIKSTSDETQDQNTDLNQGNPPPDGGDDPLADLENAANGGEDAAGGDTGGDMGGDDMGGTGGGADGDPNDLDMHGQDGATKWKNKNHYKLQQNIANFKNSVNTTYETLSNYSTPAATEEQRKVYSAAMNHLTDMKTMLEDMLTTDFNDDNYVTKLRNYIALRHVYSSVLDMLSIYFDILDRTGARDAEVIDNA